MLPLLEGDLMGDEPLIFDLRAAEPPADPAGVVRALEHWFGWPLPALNELSGVRSPWPATSEIGGWGAAPAVRFEAVAPLLPPSVAGLLALSTHTYSTGDRAAHGYALYALCQRVVTSDGFAELESVVGHRIAPLDARDPATDKWLREVERALQDDMCTE